MAFQSLVSTGILLVVVIMLNISMVACEKEQPEQLPQLMEDMDNSNTKDETREVVDFLKNEIAAKKRTMDCLIRNFGLAQDEFIPWSRIPQSVKNLCRYASVI